LFIVSFRSSDSSEIELKELLEETPYVLFPSLLRCTTVEKKNLIYCIIISFRTHSSNYRPIADPTLQTLSPTTLTHQLDRPDICFFGTSVVSGTGTAGRIRNSVEENVRKELKQ
jgi:hypothetical protein